MVKRLLTVVLALTLSACILSAYSLRFLDNAEFNSNCDYWFAVYDPPDWGTPGTIQWSSSYSNSCLLTVDGGPSVIGIMQFTKTTIYPGDTIKADIPHTNMSGYGEVTLSIAGGYFGSEFGQYLQRNDGTRSFNIVADKIYPPNTAINVKIVVWPGSGQAWVNYIRLGRSGTTGVMGNPESEHLQNTKPMLSRSFPNPTNNHATIEYNLPSNCSVVINIYNTIGQLVKTAVKEKKNAGVYTYVWNGVNDDGLKVASGTYFYSLAVDGKNIETKKLIMLK